MQQGLQMWRNPGFWSNSSLNFEAAIRDLAGVQVEPRKYHLQHKMTDGSKCIPSGLSLQDIGQVEILCNKRVNHSAQRSETGRVLHTYELHTNTASEHN